MVRPAPPGPHSPVDHPPIARGDPAGLDRGFSAVLAGLASSLSRPSSRGTGGRQASVGTPGWLGIARGGLGAGSAVDACEGLRASMAGPTLFHRPHWLGPSDPARTCQGPRLWPAPIQPDVAVCAREPATLAGAVFEPFHRQGFSGHPECAGRLIRSRRIILCRDRPSSRVVTFEG